MKKVFIYQLFSHELLGEGSFGKSYKGINEVTQQPVTMRVVSKNKIHSVDHHMKDALKSEVKTLSKIQAQNIVPFIEVLQTSHNFYLIRQYCHDGSLRDLLNKKGKLSQKQAVNILVQILKGLYQLIKRGIQHRNLIPQNILLKGQCVKISDFNLQKINENLLMCKTTKPNQYRSPQQYQGQPQNYKSDIWSLGIMLYQMLFGRCPFLANNEVHLRSSMSKQKLQFPKQVEISKQLKKFIMSCLMLDPQQRAEWSEIYQSYLLQEFGLPKLNDLNNRFASILTKLKNNLLISNLDIERYFQSKNILSNNQVNRKTFTSLIKPMAPQITEQQIDFLYSRLDKNGDEKLQIKQFEDAMFQFQIPMQSVYRRKADKLLREKDTDQQLEQQQLKQQELKRIYQGIVQNLEKKQIYDLYEIFTQSDKKRVGHLHFDQFIDLLRKIDKTLTKKECELIFQAFDKNKDKQISFNQFFRNMCKITGSPNGLPNF